MKNFKILIIVFVALIYSEFVTAQDKLLFDEIPTQNAELNTEQKRKLLKLANQKLTKDVRIIKIGKLKNIQNKGQISLKLPGINSVIKAEAVLVQYNNDNNFAWSANLTNKTGVVMIISKDEGIGGYIQCEGRSFMILPINKEKSILIEQVVETIKDGSDVCNDKDTKSLQTRALSVDYCSQTDGTNCPAIIDVLVLITPDAQTYFATMDYWSAAFYPFFLEFFTNTALMNSGITNKQIRIQTAFYNFSFSNNAQDDLNSMVANSGVINLRNQYKADLVVALKANQYYNSYGIAKTTASSPYDNAFSIVSATHAFGPRWTFAHELAHLLGCDHNLASNGGNANGGSCQHGFRFVDNTGTEQRTIMALLLEPDQNQGKVRLLQYSNPNITLNGVPTGNTDANNTKVIRNSGCSIANYFPDATQMNVLINGPDDLCEYETITLTAYVTPPAPSFSSGQPPYQYDWYASSDGISEDTYIGNGASIDVGNFGYPYFWVILKVTSNDGTVVNKSKKIYTNPVRCLYYRNPISEISNAVKTSITGMVIAPNPTKGQFSISFDLVKDEGISIDVKDIDGKSLKSIYKGNLTKGTHRTEADLSNLPAGVYIISLQSESLKEVKKLILTH
jgi:Secretion system C-terminal sorting domain/Metallo-peptidase family M12B Reprolysin-like